MLGSDKSRGSCLEMICADFLAGARWEGVEPGVSDGLAQSADDVTASKYESAAARTTTADGVNEKGTKAQTLRLDRESHKKLSDTGIGP